MALAISDQNTREGIHEFTLSGQKVKYDANLDLLYSWIGGLVPHWGAPVSPEPQIRQQIINATNGQVGYGRHFVNMPDNMNRPVDITERTRVELNPIPRITLGRIPHFSNNKRVTGLGHVPVVRRVDFSKTQPIPKRRFLEDLPVNAEELQGFISDWFESYGKPAARGGTFRHRMMRR